MDVRGVRSIEKLQEALADLDEKKIDYDILFLDANDAAIQRRYKETRRQHPLAAAEKIPITEAIARERRLLQPLRDKAKYVIDTSLLSAAQNRERVCSLFLDKGESPMELMVVSFGFKYGLPQEADLVLDVRCLPNPSMCRSSSTRLVWIRRSLTTSWPPRSRRSCCTAMSICSNTRCRST